MRANSPSAYFASVTLHALVVAVILLAGMLLSRTAPPPPVIFELVAGEPSDAPERGPSAPADLRFNVPKVKLPPQPKVEPPPQAREQARPVEKKTPPPKQELMKKAPPKQEPKTTPKQESKMSYEEFVRQHGAPKTTTQAPPRQMKAPQIDTAKVVGQRASGERGKAATASEVRDQRDYEARLIALLKAAHEETKPSGLGDAVSADVTFFLTADGQIRSAEISRSSGHPEFDQSVLAAIRRITWPGPRPDKKSDTLRVTFRMREL